MAWQLIYTSASRLLEAGRSGFGTVARHRAISPLLVSAIERASQFSRLPGTDAGRVIFCYRIVAAAGGRFHVLSSIRDAGADYTGRTNHIAHHLIADPREIAQLGTNGPSPAEVLLAMNWATSWHEQPRYLEATDEVALETLHARTNGTVWERITGSPNQAWLLASGDASRGAYVIQPVGADLREVFAESLRLMSERRWQTSFTTSLQPSDEPADFRWIGIEEKSPLRGEIETSGRPILNLALPSTLPMVEVVSPPAVKEPRQSIAATVGPLSTNERDERTSSSDPISATPSSRPSRSANEPALECRSKYLYAAATSRRKWGLLAGVATVLVTAAFVFLVGLPIYDKYKHQQAVRAEIASILGKSGFFSDKMIVELRDAEAVNIARELAQAANRSLEAAYNADFSKIENPAANEALRKRAKDAGLSIPPEITKLDARLKEIAKIQRWLREFNPQAEDDQALDQIEKRRAEAELLTSPPPQNNTFDRIKGEITSLADRQRAQAVLTLLTGASDGRVQPAQPLAWFDQALADTKSASSDDDTKLILKNARHVIDDWKVVEAPESHGGLTELEDRLKKQSAWPLWLQVKAQVKVVAAQGGKPAPLFQRVRSVVSSATLGKPAPISRVPLYFVNGKDNLRNLHIEELGSKQSYFLKPGIAEPMIELKDLNNDGNLRRSPAGDPDFKVNESEKTILLAKGAVSLVQPFRLSAKDAAGTEVFQLWVNSASGEPLFPRATNALNRKGDSLELNPSSFGLSGIPKNDLGIQLPASCFAGKSPSDSQPLKNWKVDLSDSRKQIEAQNSLWKQQLAILEKKSSEPFKKENEKFNKLVAQLEKDSNFSDQERRDLAGANSTNLQKWGGYIEAVSRPLKITDVEAIFKAGEGLKASMPSDKANAVIKSALNLLDNGIRHLNTPEEKKVAEAKLNLLRDMGNSLQSETTEADRRAETEKTKRAMNDLRTNLKLAAVNPLTLEQIPPGTYRVFARDGDVNLPLVDIQVPESPTP